MKHISAVNSSYLAQAIIQCERAIKTETNHPEQWQTAFRNLGNLLQGRGDFDRAIVWHSLTLESEVNLAEAYSQLGELQALEKNWLAALNLFETALQYLPDSPLIYSSLAQINGQLQRQDAEMECWYKATQLNPNLMNQQGYYKLARALERRGKMSEAIACYQQATAGGEGVVAAFFDLGEIYQRQGKLDQAQDIYQKILAAEPTEARAQYKLGTVYLQKGCFEQAIDCFRQTIKDAPDFPWAYRDLVKTFLILKRWDEAISTCYAILNLVEEYPWVYSHLGNALREKGRLSEAAVNFQKACEQRGWHQCVANNYFFTVDIFSHRISIWLDHLKPLIGQAIKVLEVGCYQGMSSCWMLDRLLIEPTSQLTCIDRNFDPKFTENITKTGAAERVTFLEGDIFQLMSGCAANSFDLINLQNRVQSSQHSEKNTELAWKLVKPGGLIIFSHYGWHNPKSAPENQRVGIDQFLNSVTDQWQRVHLSVPIFQLIIRKL